MISLGYDFHEFGSPKHPQSYFGNSSFLWHVAPDAGDGFVRPRSDTATISSFWMRLPPPLLGLVSHCVFVSSLFIPMWLLLLLCSAQLASEGCSPVLILLFSCCFFLSQCILSCLYNKWLL